MAKCSQAFASTDNLGSGLGLLTLARIGWNAGCHTQFPHRLSVRWRAHPNALQVRRTDTVMTPANEADEDEESAGIAVEELEAKMSSVQETLERFDAVKVGTLVDV